MNVFIDPKRKRSNTRQRASLEEVAAVLIPALVVGTLMGLNQRRRYREDVMNAILRETNSKYDAMFARRKM